jgi:MFS family permease
MEGFFADATAGVLRIGFPLKVETHGMARHLRIMQDHSPSKASSSAARRALALLLGINLFCYLDRYILAAIIPNIKLEFLSGDPDANGKAGLLTTAFLFSYMLTAPVFGWMADRFSRWKIIAVSVGVWSLASGASGLAAGFTALLLTRVFLGVGEAGYGPAAPTIISDLYPIEKRGLVLSWFFMAIPVGSAFGYVLGGMVDHYFGWRWAFYLVTPPGLLLAAFCAFMPEPKRGGTHQKANLSDYEKLLKIPSLITNIAAQAAMTFAIGGLSVWAPTYIHEARGLPLAQVDLIFGGILVVAGLMSTLLGGWLGDKLRLRFPGAYFLVSGWGMLLGFPATIAMLYVPFPYAWIFIFLAMAFLFLNIGPSNTAIANVTPPAMRATAFALNILVIHLLGDALSPWLIGWIKDHGTWNLSFFAVSTVMLLAGIIWLCSSRALVRDTEAVEAEERSAQG